MTTISSTTTSTASSSSANAGAADATSLNKDQFLKLLVGQLRHQDPMNPSGGQDYIAQMAQFAMVEQTTEAAAAANRTMAALERSNAVGLIGRTVSYEDASGVTQQGVVERVSVKDGAATLTVGGVEGISPGGVQEVR